MATNHNTNAERRRHIATALQESISAGDLDRAVDTVGVAHLTGQAVITVQQQRGRGEGPPFFRIGRSVRYRLGDVLAYRDANTVGKKVAK